jgi:ubiquinone/menaquinone biosynthesis C-methylase UbiE
MQLTDPYRRIARFYDTAVEPFNASLRRFVLKFAQTSENMRVLEVGCGTGTNLELFAARGCHVAGIDLSPSMVEVARKKLGERAEVHLADAADMPFNDGAFDLSVAFLTLHEMPVEVRLPVVAEMARVTKGSGRLVFVDFHMGPYDFPKGWLYRSVIIPIEIAVGLEHFRSHRDFLRRKGLSGIVSESGLTLERDRLLGGGTMHVCAAQPHCHAAERGE